MVNVYRNTGVARSWVTAEVVVIVCRDTSLRLVNVFWFRRAKVWIAADMGNAKSREARLDVVVKSGKLSCMA